MNRWLVVRPLIVVLLAILLLGCDDGTPEPTFWAPDDLAAVLPPQVGGLDLEIEATGGSDELVAALGAEALDFLLGCTPPVARCRPEAVRFALASSSDSAEEPRLVMFAFRVDGVPAMDLAADSESGPFVHVTPADAAEYAPIVREIARPGEGWLDLYPLGEVLYGAVATADGLGVRGEDVAAALPSCTRYGSEPCRGPS